MAVDSSYNFIALTGKKGAQGEKGEKGDSGTAANYLGILNSLPESASVGDYFVAGNTLQKYKKIDVNTIYSLEVAYYTGDHNEMSFPVSLTKGEAWDGLYQSDFLKINTHMENTGIPVLLGENDSGTEVFTCDFVDIDEDWEPYFKIVTTTDSTNYPVGHFVYFLAQEGEEPIGWDVGKETYTDTTILNGDYSDKIGIETSWYWDSINEYQTYADVEFIFTETTYTPYYIPSFVYTYTSSGTWEQTDDIKNIDVFSDIVSLANSANNATAVQIVKRLVASDIFVENLAAQKILFQNYVGSFESENSTAKVGDTIISMGVNPKDSTDTDYSFIIQRCIRAANESTGTSEVWMKHFWTKFLASGLLTLNLSGCLQLNNDVKINPASTLSQVATFHNQISTYQEFDINGTKTAFVVLCCGDILKSTDGKNWTQIYTGKYHSLSSPKDNPYYPADIIYYYTLSGGFKNKQTSKITFITGDPENDSWDFRYYNESTETLSDPFYSLQTAGWIPQGLCYYNSKYYFTAFGYPTEGQNSSRETGISNTILYSVDFTAKNIELTEEYSQTYTQKSFFQSNFVINGKMYSIGLGSGDIYEWDDDSNEFVLKKDFDNLSDFSINNDKIIVCPSDTYFYYQDLNDFDPAGEWIKVTPTLSDGTTPTESLRNCLYANNLYLFNTNSIKAENGKYYSTIYSSADLVNWSTSKVETSTTPSFVYSNIFDTYLLIATASSTSYNTDGKGILMRADYESVKDSLSTLQSNAITSKSLGTSSSYIKFANGLLIQWGKDSNGCGATSTISYKTITLPLSYTSSSSYIALVSGTAASSAVNHCCSVNYQSAKNSFNTCETYNSQHRWITIGY